MNSRIPLLVIALLVAVTVAAIIPAKIEKAKAIVDDFHLYGSAFTGWGLSSDNQTIPGPTLSVNFGDDVNLTITNLDSAATHQFLLSYHNSSSAQAGDPVSIFIAAGTSIIFHFVANVSEGTFTYYCTFHPTVMHGTFVVLPSVPEYPSIVLPTLIMAAIGCFLLAKRKGLLQGRFH